MSQSPSTVPLTAGNPDETPATFSRFILPFAFHPELLDRHEHRHDVPRWKKIEGPDLHEAKTRFRYFTIETADVLYKRASWWQLESAEGGPSPGIPFDVPRLRGGSASGCYRAQIMRPMLVLFEWQPAYGRLSLEDPIEDDLMTTGFLMVDICFPEPDQSPEYDDLLQLNELFRYWQEPYPNHSKEDTKQKQGGFWYRHILGNAPLDPVRNDKTIAEAAAENDQKPGTHELYTQRWSAWLDCPLAFSEDQFRLFPTTFAEKATKRLRYPHKADAEGWAIYADPRTFVWTCAQVPGGAAAIAKASRQENEDLWNLERWIQLLNVDRASTQPVLGTAFEQAWAEQRTYKRWLHYGSLYGFTYHSGAMISSPESEPPLWHHFRTTYSDQILLLLYLRVTTFRFSRALARHAAEARDGSQDRSERHVSNQWLERFERLQHDFVLLTDLYQFPLVSNQQQAVEMYAIAREFLDVDALFQEIKAEVSATDGLFDNLLARRFSRAAHLGIPLALVTGLFGMNIIIEGAAKIVEPAAGASVWSLGIEVLVFVFVAILITSLFARQVFSLRSFLRPARRWGKRLRAKTLETFSRRKG